MPPPGRDLRADLRARLRADLAWLWRWPARSPRTGRLAAAPIFLLALVGIINYLQMASRYWHGTAPLNDFFALWAWSAMIHALAHPLAIYDPAQVQRFMRAAYAGFHGHYPFAYPPSFLLLIWPLGLMRRPVAYAVWVTLGVLAYLGAVAPGPWRRQAGLLVLFAPTTAVAIATGQDGLLMAALLIGGCRLLPRRPLLAGVLFGVLSFKPQFGLMVPLALLAAGQWRTIATAAATVLASVLASAAAFGWGMWERWFLALWGLSTYVGGRARLFPLMPTVTANLHLLGGGPLLRGVAQAAAMLLVGAGVWWCWRRHGTGGISAAVLQVGALLAAPYGFFYDLPLLTGAAVAVVRERVAADASFNPMELLVLFGTGSLASLMLNMKDQVPWSGLVLPPLFAFIVLRAWRIAPAAAPAPGARPGA
jgi:hypothetical protein